MAFKRGTSGLVGTQACIIVDRIHAMSIIAPGLETGVRGLTRLFGLRGLRRRCVCTTTAPRLGNYVAYPVFVTFAQ